jgi:formimidoylglutamate deiminase
LPGLVNVHASSWRRLLRGRPDPKLAERVAHDLTLPDQFETARLAFVELLLAGVTCVGEFHDLPRGAEEVLRAAKDVGIRIALLPVATQGGAAQFLKDTEALRAFTAANHPADEAWLGVGVSGDAWPADELKALTSYAHAQRFRVQGPAAPFVAQGLVDKRFTAIDGATLTEEQVKGLGAVRAAVCVCPALDRRLPPIDKLLAAGVGIAVGSGRHTQGNFLADARELEPALRGATATFHAATVTGARSLGATGGALEVGRPADFFTVNLLDPSLAGSDPASLLNHVVFAVDRRAIHEVWVGARQRVSGGRHPNQGAIVGRFADVQKRLGSAG